jgi:proteasome lid subunit RPN8/RPN11
MHGNRRSGRDTQRKIRMQRLRSYSHLISAMLRISKGHLHSVRRSAESCYPNECCGVLLGKLVDGERVVFEVVSCKNVAAGDQRDRYHIDPAELIDVQKRARDGGLDIVGFFHSHPDHPPAASRTDLKEALWFACSYLIVEMRDGRAADVASFVLAGTDEQDKRLDAEQIEITEAAGRS